MAKVDVSGLDPAAVLAALYNASCPLGMGFLQYDPKPMTIQEADEYLAIGTRFDYLNGRLMKVEIIVGDELEAGLYDRDLGDGQAANVIEILRRTGDPCCDEILQIHATKVGVSVESLRSKLDTETTVTGSTIKLGFSDVKPELEQAIKNAGIG